MEEATFSKIDRIAGLFYAGVKGAVKQGGKESLAVRAEAVSRSKPGKRPPDAGDYSP
jgi:hypothetical protein